MTALVAKHHRRPDDGFTLIELLVVIIILGVLSAVVVFAVKGVGDKGESNAIAIDERTIRTALEAHCAQKGTYPIDPNGADEYPDPMDMLVEAKFLSERSTKHELETGTTYTQGNCNGKNYKLTPEKILDPVDPDPPAPPEWQFTSNELQLGSGRAQAIVLNGANCGQNCGKVLVLTEMGVGGGRSVLSADVYNPLTDRWEAAIPPPPTGGYDLILRASMLLIPGDDPLTCGVNCGRILVHLPGVPEMLLYDPPTGTWLTTAQPITPCFFPGTMTALGNGKILLVSGNQDDFSTDAPCYHRAELYDPLTGLWLPTTPPKWAYSEGISVTLTNGKALLVGGYERLEPGNIYNYAQKVDPNTGQMGDYGEIYDSVSATWSDTATTELGALRGLKHVLPLNNGKVLTLSRRGLLNDAIAEVYDPGTGSWTPASPCEFCWSGGLTPLAGGKVIATGGQRVELTPREDRPDLPLITLHDVATAEVFDPNTNLWTPLPALKQARRGHAGVILGNGPGCDHPRCGHVMVIGGEADEVGGLVTAETRLSP